MRSVVWAWFLQILPRQGPLTAGPRPWALPGGLKVKPSAAWL